MIPEQIQKFIDSFSKLPALGPRLATRLAFYLINLDKNDLRVLETSLGDLKRLGRCKQCFFTKSGGNLCAICANPKRDKTTVAIVEKDTDLISLEKTGKFQGHYLLLGELPERGILESGQKLRLEHLKTRIGQELGGKIKEIIIALNPTSAGDFTAELIKKEFAGLAGKITRLGRGIPTGGEIEFADEETLDQALERRN